MNDGIIKITIITNITLEPYFRKCVEQTFSLHKLNYELALINYAEYRDTCSEDVLKHSKYVVVFLNIFEISKEAVQDVNIMSSVLEDNKQLYKYIRGKTKANVFWIGYEDYSLKSSCIFGHIGKLSLIDKINTFIADFLLDDDAFIDLKALIAKVGVSASYENKNKYRWNSPYSNDLLSELCSELLKQHFIINGITPKCLVLDCDNVLWGGVLSEDGLQGVRLGDGLGRSFRDFQRFILEMYYHGVILAICSKNDEEDVLRMFREHSGMILKEEHIACFMVNWDDKASNIKRISEILNIGLDSMVFVDDSEFEIHSVKATCPEVKCILYNRETVYNDLSCFNLRKVVDTTKIKQRVETYRTNVKREALKSQSKSFDDYLQSLKMKIDIHLAELTEYARISELSQRTNKCTNGMRYTLDEINALDSEYELYSVTLSDKFSNLGLVGAMGIYKNKLDLFSLSCRALGRNVERAMLEYVKGKYNDFRYKSTMKNESIVKLLEEYIK